MSLILVTLGAVASAENVRPVIGVFTQPLNIEDGVGSDAKPTYLAASYVKFVESGGARVVPVHFDASESDLRTIMSRINGLLFPGGGADILTGSAFRDGANIAWDAAMKSGIPVWGTCLGMQLISVLASGDDGVLCSGCFGTEGTPLPLNLTPAAFNSSMLARFPPDLISALQRENITENSHRSGVRPSQFGPGTTLGKMFDVLSTNVDPTPTAGGAFVSTFQAKNGKPVFATQWHPEKANL